MVYIAYIPTVQQLNARVSPRLRDSGAYMLADIPAACKL